uniref:Uncharacterized protein n=1 Tax=Amphimedon queenslandica TaxID=400682 RepID=A0A1X7U2I8_AMPQE
MESSRQSKPGADDPPDLTMEIKVPHSPGQSLEPPAPQRKCGEMTDDKNVWEESIKTRVFVSFTASQISPSVNCDF